MKTSHLGLPLDTVGNIASDRSLREGFKIIDEAFKSIDLSKSINVRDYGAIGDGVSRPLSTLYATLEEAQVDYPSATALSNELDGVAIQKCLNAASAAGKAVIIFPNNGGRYLFNTDIIIPYSRTGNQGYIVLLGDGGSDNGPTKLSTLRRTNSYCSIKFQGTSFTAGYGNALGKYLRIEHMVFDGGWASHNTNSDYPLMQIDNGYEVIMNDVGFCQCIGHALIMREVMDSRFHDVRFNWCGQHFGYNKSMAMTSGSTTATVASTTGLFVGQRIYGTGIHGLKVASIVNGTTITLSSAANYTGSRNVVFEAKAALHICSNDTAAATSNNLVMDGFRMESGPGTALRIDGLNIVDIWLNNFKAEFSHYALDYLVDITNAAGVMVRNGWLYADPDIYSNFTFDTTSAGKTLASALSSRIDSFSLNAYVATTGDCTNGSNVVSNIPDTSNIKVGMEMMGTGSSSSHLSGYVVTAINSSTQVTLNSNFTGTTGNKTTNFGYRFDNGNFNARQFFSGMPIIAFDRDDPRNYMLARVTYWDTVTAALTLHVLEVFGDTAKSITNWTVAATHAGLIRYAEGATISQGSFIGGYAPFSVPDSRPYLHAFTKVEGARSIDTEWYATIGQHALPASTWKAMSSTTSLTIGTGSKTLTIKTGLPTDMFPVNGPVFISAKPLAQHSNWMKGYVSAYNSGTGQLDVVITETNGSGTFASWAVGFEQQPLVMVDSSSSLITGRTFQQSYANPAGSATNVVGVMSDVNQAKGASRVRNLVTINSAQFALLTPNQHTIYILPDTGKIYYGSTLVMNTKLNAVADSGLNTVLQDKYRSGSYYLAANPGDALTTNGANTLNNDTCYAHRVIINAPVTISKLLLKTSSANTSVGASVKVGIYNAKADGKPDVLIASTAAATTIGDSAISTVYEITLDAPVTLQPGIYYFCAVLAHTTTGSRWVSISTAGPAMIIQGTDTAAACMSGTGYIGYSIGMTQANFPASYTSFPASAPTVWKSGQYLPVFGFLVA